DSKELECWIRVQLHDPIAASSLTATLSGHPLAVSPGARETGWVEIHEPDKDLKLRKYLCWPAGMPIEIRVAGQPLEPRVVDWEVFPKELERDSRSRAAWRPVWLVIQSLLYLAAFVAAAFALWPDKSEAGSTPGELIVIVIDAVEGSSHAETRAMRIFLRKFVHEGAGASEAAASAGLSRARAAVALQHFQARADQLAGALAQIDLRSEE